MTITRGSRRLEAVGLAYVAWKIRTTAVPNSKVRQVASTHGITRSQLIRDAVLSYVHALALDTPFTDG